MILRNRSIYDATLTELAKFQHAYIFSGHTHRNQTYVHTGYPTAGGDYVTEVVHCAACGQFWNLSISSDGSPAGYTIYTFEGPRAKLQRYKAIGYSGGMSADTAPQVWKNNIRMYSAYERYNGSYMTYYYCRGTGNKSRIIANVFMSHQGGGKAGELSGDWVVQLYDSKLKKWVDMQLITKAAGPWRTVASANASFSELESFYATNTNGTQVIRNDVDWWWWSFGVEANSYITNRNGNKWAGAGDNSGYQHTCSHIWWGDLSYELTDAQIAGTATHTVKVRAIPPHYGTNATVQTAIANGTDLNDYGMIYICDEFAHYGQSKSDAQGLDWTTVTSSAWWD